MFAHLHKYWFYEILCNFLHLNLSFVRKVFPKFRDAHQLVQFFFYVSGTHQSIHVYGYRTFVKYNPAARSNIPYTARQLPLLIEGCCTAGIS